MSADNGVYILETPTGGALKEYRVRHIMAVENVSWDDECQNYVTDEDIVIANARRMWKDCTIFTKRGEALEFAADMLEKLDICEYGISFIKINRKF